MLKPQQSIDYNQNIFEQQEIINFQNLQPDRERPRANLYNVIKKLRENSVSITILIAFDTCMVVVVCDCADQV